MYLRAAGQHYLSIFLPHDVGVRVEAQVDDVAPVRGEVTRADEETCGREVTNARSSCFLMLSLVLSVPLNSGNTGGKIRGPRRANLSNKVSKRPERLLDVFERRTFTRGGGCAQMFTFCPLRRAPIPCDAVVQAGF